MSDINVVNLTKKFGNTVAVDDISFEVQSGDFLGFIGPNGAGKTTTIKTILNLLRPSTGNIELLGTSNKQVSFLEDVGYVAGEASLYNNLTATDQIDYFASYYKNVDLKYLSKLKQMFSIAEHKKISELSLGNKKKIAIVCALMHKPKILFLDEASNSLDPLVQKTLFAELNRLNKQGTTVFFSSHNLEEVQTYCKNVIIIRDGKIIKSDTVENIVQSVGVSVRIKTSQKLNPGFFAKHNITYKETSGGVNTFIYKGDINELVYYTSKYKLEMLHISSVKLEDIFEQYFEEVKK